MKLTPLRFERRHVFLQDPKTVQMLEIAGGLNGSVAYGSHQYITADNRFTILRTGTEWQVYPRIRFELSEKELYAAFVQSGIEQVLFTRRGDAVDALEAFLQGEGITSSV